MIQKMLIDLAVKYLRAGKAVVFPTDTAYGLGVDAANSRAVKRLFRIKKRRPTKPVHIVVADLKMAKRYAVFTPQAEKLFKEFLPGPLTLILELRATSPGLATPKPSTLLGNPDNRPPSPRLGRELSAGTGTIGIRMPNNKVSLELVKRLKRPITATSANISDAPTAYSISQIAHQYRKQRLKPDIILDSGLLPRVRPSTMVNLTGNRIQIVRRGPITKTQIKKCIASVSRNISPSRRTAK